MSPTPFRDSLQSLCFRLPKGALQQGHFAGTLVTA
ncbi:hypothetical protein X975_23752, partial [Stegodyphus mimosarum]